VILVALLPAVLAFLLFTDAAFTFKPRRRLGGNLGDRTRPWAELQSTMRTGGGVRS
jgi:hypothetical protein